MRVNQSWLYPFDMDLELTNDHRFNRRVWRQIVRALLPRWDRS